MADPTMIGGGGAGGGGGVLPPVSPLNPAAMGAPPQQIDPVMIMRMMAMQGQQPQQQTGSVLPPQGGPVQPNGSPSDVMNMMQSLYQPAQQQLQETGQRMRGVEARQADLGRPENQPPMGYHPKYEPITGGKTFLRDIGRGLLQGLSLTGPGANILSNIQAPGIARYEMQRQNLADQLAALKSEAEIPTEEMRGATGMAQAASLASYRQQAGQAKVTTAQAAMMNAQTRQLSDQHKTALGQAANDIKLKLGQGKLTQEQARTQLMGVIARERDATLRDVAATHADATERVEQQRAAEQDFKTESDHWMQDLFGTAPTKPVKPAAGGGVTKPTATGSASGKGVTHVFVPGQGLKPAGGS